MDDHTLHWWAETMDLSMVISLIVAAVAAAAVGVTTWLSIKYNGEVRAREAAAFARYRVEADVLIADAKREGIEAGKAAGDAILRAAQLEQESERLKAANLALEVKIAPRRLDAAQQQRLGAVFSRYPGRMVRVGSYSLDAEAALLGQQILNSLQGARLPFEDARMSEASLGSLLVGISVTGTDRLLVTELISVFLEFKWRPTPQPLLPSAGMSVGRPAEQVSATIFIGVKPFSE